MNVFELMKGDGYLGLGNLLRWRLVYQTINRASPGYLNATGEQNDLLLHHLSSIFRILSVWHQ